jgi:hypothetical protein
MQDLGPTEVEPSNKRQKSALDNGLGPQEGLGFTIGLPAPGLLYRQLTLDEEEHNDGSAAVEVESPSVISKHACFGAGDNFVCFKIAFITLINKQDAIGAPNIF